MRGRPAPQLVATGMCSGIAPVGVLDYVELASDRCDLPTLDDLFLEADTDRYWLLCHTIRFAARCAYHRVAQMQR